ncbi:MAG: uracil-DNA glycosylase [Sideroxyarcus sp.]|nr:uracil-DNA glycosylase [Sideroxyarcus sp.]
MNIRDDDVLRELNLYPLWVRRDEPVAGRDLSRQESAGTKPRPQISDPSAEPAGLKSDLQVRQVATDWATLKQQVHDCTACVLRAGCTQTVFGVGDEHADWLFVGEGPGADEDAQGEPFVGQAGKLLDNMLAAIKLKRGENVYIANVVKCRPPANRTPTADEVATCLPWLHQQIALIQPKLIVALGKTAATALLGREATLGSLRGMAHDYQGTPLIVTYHPAYLLRSPVEKAKAWQDLCLATRTMAG